MENCRYIKFEIGKNAVGKELLCLSEMPGGILWCVCHFIQAAYS
jgi:hypothetical protein